jgi:hypothetical protein
MVNPTIGLEVEAYILFRRWTRNILPTGIFLLCPWNGCWNEWRSSEQFLTRTAIAAPMGMDMGMDADAGMPDLRCKCHLSGACTSRAMKYLGLYSNIQGHEHCFWTRRFWPRYVCHSFLVLWATGQAWTRLVSSCALTTKIIPRTSFISVM